ncbi:MAG: sterol desaturase family protein [Polyangiaceae bacterium]|jgi:dihydroceramide fatty acyl 2-hydroxylase
MTNHVLEPRLANVTGASGSNGGARGNGNTCRMFDNDWLERFSRIHPATPFVAWVPVVGFFLIRSTLRHDLARFSVAALFAGGMLAWTLAEYVLHKFVFHWTNDTTWGKRVHFLLHGVHHEYPGDKDRLVMPLLTSVPLAVLFYTIFSIAMGRPMGEPFFAGFVLGYLFYDGTHYYVHHFVPTTRWGKFLRRHHMTHHFADHDGGFGVSSPLWDLVFETMPAKKK